jgi:hypothetical protein
VTIEIRYEEKGRKKVTYDPLNPRIYTEEWKCHECQTWIDQDEIVWAMENGTLSTDRGNPYCVECCPQEEPSAGK